MKNTKNQYDCNKKPADVLIRLSGCESDERPYNRAQLAKGKGSYLSHQPNTEGAVDDINKRATSITRICRITFKEEKCLFLCSYCAY
jgi:hypothetical protein